MRKLATVVLATVLLVASVSAWGDGAFYAFLTPDQWDQIKSYPCWAIPRESPDGDTLVVKQCLPQDIPANWLDTLAAVGVDTTADVLNLEDARNRVSAWVDTLEG